MLWTIFVVLVILWLARNGYLLCSPTLSWAHGVPFPEVRISCTYPPETGVPGRE
jgi:hypothetical protein